jgi:hypothetical protein
MLKIADILNRSAQVQHYVNLPSHVNKRIQVGKFHV